MMVMMHVMVHHGPAMRESDRLEVKIGDAGGDVQPGLSLHAERLQGVGILRTADQEVAATADTHGCVGADAAVSPCEFAVSEPAGRRIHRPGKAGLRGDADIEAEALHRRHIGFGTAAFALKYAIEASHRADDKTDILPAMALQDAR